MQSVSVCYRLGQVGGFPLRLSWLPRLVSIDGSHDLSDKDKVGLSMGIGDNMVKALRIWAMATGILDDKYSLTKRANQLFGRKTGEDIYAEKDDTLWLLHWLLCSNPKCFTANAWLLNFFHSHVFTMDDALNAFSSRLGSEECKYAMGTIRVDLETAIRMYAPADDGKRNSDLDDKCFHSMGLLKYSRGDGRSRYFRVLRDEQPRLCSRVVLYSIIDAMSKQGITSSAFSDLYSSDTSPSPGVVFGLTKDGFWQTLEATASKYKTIISLHPMSDGDAQVRLSSKYAKMIDTGAETPADQFYFKK